MKWLALLIVLLAGCSSDSGPKPPEVGPPKAPIIISVEVSQ
jgi:hypothetical protein